MQEDAPCESVEERVNPAGGCHEAAGEDEEAVWRVCAGQRGHAPNSEGEREQDIHDWVDGHVRRGTLDAVEVLAVGHADGLYAGPEIEKDGGVDDDGACFKQEDPEVVEP